MSVRRAKALLAPGATIVSAVIAAPDDRASRHVDLGAGLAEVVRPPPSQATHPDRSAR